MNNTYYLSDGYFTDIIKSYFDQLKWKSVDKKPATLCHANFSTCSNCQFTNGLLNPDPINDKIKIHQSLKQIGVVDFLFPFYAVNQNDAYRLESIFTPHDYWIIKPSDGLRQKDILITNSFIEFVVHLSQNTNYQGWLVQKYLKNPLLYNGKKCHFRVYALIKITNQPKKKLELYVYPKGYLYIADKPYIFGDFVDGEIHLTTSCNNQEFPTQYDKYFGNGQFEKVIFPQIKKIVYWTVYVTQNQLDCPNVQVQDSCCYKMLGYDLIADQNKKIYLMEVNAKVIGMSSTDLPGNCKSKNPSLQTPEFKRELMCNIMDLVLFSKPGKFIKLI